MEIIEFLEEKDEERLAYYMEVEALIHGIMEIGAATVEPVGDLTVWEMNSFDTTKMEGYDE